MGTVAKIGKRIGLAVVVLACCLLAFRAVNQYVTAREAERVTADGGISELVELEVNGTRQYLLLEGQDAKRPILLFLHGGPGQPFPFGVGSRGAFPQITENFVAVYYDQRGSGKSYSKDIPLETMNIEQFLDDTDVVVDYLLDRFGAEKVSVAGVSWGSIIGTKYSSRHPEKVAMYIGLSQFVDNRETQARSKEWLLEIARTQGDQRLLDDLATLGAPPYTGQEEELLFQYISQYGGVNYRAEDVAEASIFGLLKHSLISPDYSLSDIYKATVSGATFSLSEAQALQQEINQVNLLREVPELPMPVYIFQGAHDKLTNYHLAKEFSDRLSSHEESAFVTLEHSAHYPNAEDFAVILSTLEAIATEKGLNGGY